MSKFEWIKSEWKEIFTEASKARGFQLIGGGGITVEHYKNLLRQIYFHTRENPQIQTVATAYFRGTQRSLVKNFLQHALSEVGHDQLALNDLARLGVDTATIQNEAPLPSTMALISFPYYQIQYLNPVGYLGYLFHLEFMPTQNGGRYMETLARIGVPSEAMTFIEEHSTVDVAHNKLMERYIDKLVVTDDDLDAVIYAARVTAKLYANMITEAVETAHQAPILAKSVDSARYGNAIEAIVPMPPAETASHLSN